MRRHVVALLVAGLALGPVGPHVPAHAQEPSYECAVPVPAKAPVPTARQAEYRAGLHALATGAGVKVAVIDTGVAPHEELPRLYAGPDFVAPDSPDAHLDCDLHGTVVAGVIGSRSAGIAPGAELVSIRQSSAHYRRQDDAAAGTLESLARAIEAAVDEGARVINASVVSCVPPGIAAGLNTRALDAALRRAEEAGAVVVAAAGNAGDTGAGCQPGDVVYPAHSHSVVSVGALEAPHTPAGYSLPGQLSAPGSVPIGLSAQGWASGRATGDGRGGSAPFQGTSFAAPIVAGTAALLLEREPDLSPAQVRARLARAAEPGTGFIDPQVALALPGTAAAPTPRQVAATAPRPEPSDAPRRLGLLAAGVLGGAFLICCLAGLGLQRRLPRESRALREQA